MKEINGTEKDQARNEKWIKENKSAWQDHPSDRMLPASDSDGVKLETPRAPTDR